jgi:hypothetical protein
MKLGHINKWPILKYTFQFINLGEHVLVRLAIIGTLILGIFSFCQSSSADKFTCANALKNLDSKIRNNQFVVDRDLSDYRSYFGAPFNRTLSKLRKGMLWIDMGAGAALAQRQWFKRSHKSWSPDLISVGYAMPTERNFNEDIREAEQSSRGKFRYVEGMQTPASIRLFPKTDLITDNLGIFEYSRQKRAILESYIERLNFDGTLMIVHHSGNPEAIESLLEKRSDIKIIECDENTIIVKKIN